MLHWSRGGCGTVSFGIWRLEIVMGIEMCRDRRRIGLKSQLGSVVIPLNDIMFVS